MQKNLKMLRSRMRCVRIFHYFRRNNPRYTNRYYYRFIEMVGPEKYLHSPLVRNEWDAARYSFDKMYGLVSAWCESFEIIRCDNEGIQDMRNYLDTLFSAEISTLKNHCYSAEKGLYDFIRKADEEEGKQHLEFYMRLRDSISELEADMNNKDKTEYALLTERIKNTKKIITLYKQLAEFSDSEKAYAIKKFEELSGRKEEKKEEKNKEENKDGFSDDVQTDTANATDSLPA